MARVLGLAAFTSKRTPQPAAPKAHFRQQTESILAERDRQLAEIELIRRGRGNLRGFAKKAHTLLTRGWGKATWQARAELIKAAAWLLQLEHLRDLVSGV